MTRNPAQRLNDLEEKAIELEEQLALANKSLRIAVTLIQQQMLHGPQSPEAWPERIFPNIEDRNIIKDLGFNA